MRVRASAILPKNILSAIKRQPAPIQVSPILLDAAQSDRDVLLRVFQTSPSGLTEAEARAHLKEMGPNVVAQERRHTKLILFGKAMVNPLVILLLLLAGLAFSTGDMRAGVVMSLMVVLGVALRFVQEARADTAAAKLKAMISVTATVIRDGQAREVPLAELVPGDVVHSLLAVAVLRQGAV